MKRIYGIRILRFAAALLLGASLVFGGCGSSSAQESSAPSKTTVTASSSETQESSSLPSATVKPTETATPEPTEEPAAPDDETGIGDEFESVFQVVETTDYLNVRTGPGTDYETVAVLSPGTYLQKVGDGGEWSQILYGDDICYVNSDFLELIADDQDLDTFEIPGDEQGEGTASEREPFSGDLNALSNESIPYGFSSLSRDEYNRPEGVFYYESLYGNYAADFIAPNTNTIYLTMDEGYEAGYTPEILDTLAEKGVKAVFFCTMQFVTQNPDLVQRMIDEGHIVGNHSTSHPSSGMPSLGIEGQTEDILGLHNYVLENFGYEMTLFRYPEGTFSEQSLALIETLGYHAVFWSFAHVDWITDDQPDEAEALQNCIDQLHPGAIYLLHAVSSTNTHNLGAFIDAARAAGYEFGVYPKTGF